MKKEHVLLVTAALVLIFAVGFTATITGFVTFHDTPRGVVVGDEKLSFEKASLVECCTFTVAGEAKTCSVITGYDCGYCAEYCTLAG